MAVDGSDSNQDGEHQRTDCRALPLGRRCDGWYLVKNNRLTVIQEKMPAGSSETRHLHQRSQQFFFVLKGEGTLEVNGKILVLHEGDGALVPPGTAHRIENRSAQELLLQVTSEPPSHADRVELSAR